MSDLDPLLVYTIKPTSILTEARGMLGLHQAVIKIEKVHLRFKSTMLYYVPAESLFTFG